MLVLSRKPGEAIRIGDDIEISIVEVRGDTVRIGINAPRTILVYRREIYEQIREENIKAAKIIDTVNFKDILFTKKDTE
ncbi:MAG: carbon storage regulator [Verrucomicrobiae bacterium]|nr:carbon storage regulator [Verrucomicrobiae bacterium]